MEKTGRLLAIDYGLKRTGLAVSDPMRIIATALDVVDTATLLDHLSAYIKHEPVVRFIVGMPRRFNNQESDTALAVRRFMTTLHERFPDIPMEEFDERFTTVRALDAMLEGGMKKKDRREKGAADKISATLILQEYMALQKLKG